MTLYDITSDYRELFDQFDDADDLTDEQVEAYFDTLEALEGDFDTKAENIACFIKELQGESDMLDVEIKALKARKQVKDNIIKRLKRMLIDSMVQLDKKKIDRPRAKLSLHRNPESADIADERAFIEWAERSGNDFFLRYSTPEIRKTAVKAALKSGAELPSYVKLVRTMSIIIK